VLGEIMNKKSDESINFNTFQWGVFFAFALVIVVAILFPSKPVEQIATVACPVCPEIKLNQTCQDQYMPDIMATRKNANDYCYQSIVPEEVNKQQMKDSLQYNAQVQDLCTLNLYKCNTILLAHNFSVVS